MSGKIAASALARKREADALNLRIAGANYQQIANHLGVSVGTAYKAFQRGLARLAPIPEREEMRRIEAERLDRLQAAHWAKAIGGCPIATAVVLNIMGRRARMLGLDSEPVEKQIAHLRVLLAEMERMPEDDLLRLLGYHQVDEAQEP